jgi:hypothetical protein
VYWIVLATVTEAATLRGLLSARRAADSPALRVDFVHGNVYSDRASRFRDAWSPRYGMELENKPKARQTLLDRMDMATAVDRPPGVPPLTNPFPDKDFLVAPPITCPTRLRLPEIFPVLVAKSSSSSLPLLQRLGPIVLPQSRQLGNHPGRSGLDPADGGAL